jgi:hypothetical protein
MRTSLVLLISVIVVLISALVVLAIFAGGIEKIPAFINAMMSGGDYCEAQCQQYKAFCAEDKPYNMFFGCSDREGSCICPR